MCYKGRGRFSVMRRIVRVSRRFHIIVALCAILAAPGHSTADDSKDGTPDRFGYSVIWGTVGDPLPNRSFFMVNVFTLMDYERVWSHPAPDELRFKVEASLGGSADQRFRPMLSAGILAFHYLPWMNWKSFKPYAEAGVGLIYSDFRVEGQALNLNFNPQAGLGAEMASGDGGSYFLALRIHHMSNGGLHRDNRGVNSGVVQFGRYF